ncbi:acyltransferase [Nitrosomonas sp. Is35]|uniref:acyltransferase family protein n=1 Tax=unclassified Nitrosomonas TaxID=2609265 RepID=UPI00294AD901|nr:MULTISPECIES: acyltransferase [unclassified Nitrosomonas]MDV6342891.1 acyltransferase [Nitrosomonas sp. Is24]MDV6348796.1 acyltransferase [Nitrosomonas sp. Is35]
MQADHRARMPFMDALKAICCLLIVAHHLALYGPMPDFAYPLMPGLLDWLREDGRIAVQLFFVIAGFFAAAKLAPQGLSLVSNPIELIQQRYVRLITPYLAALTLAIGAAALARIWMQHESIPGTPNLFQLLAHIFLLQDLLNQEVLSAGVWYVAIDFQLFALTILVFWIANQMQHRYSGLQTLGLFLIFILTTVSLFFFNRDRYWDETALYFFGAYGLGILIYWASVSKRPVLWLAVLIAVIIAALLLDFRARIAVAGVVALLLGLAQYFDVLQSRHIPGYLAYLGRASYSIFLIHFPVLLIINAAFFRFMPHQPEIQLCGLLLAMCASIGAGMLLFNWLEARPVSKRMHILLPAGFMTCGLLAML